MADVLAGGASYGHGDDYAGRNVNLEFVSANPTGPLHLGGTRWAAVGDALGRVLAARGAKVVREYYFNDAGGQIDRFVRSLVAAALGEPAPEDGYGGAYIGEIAARVVAAEPDALSSPHRDEIFRRVGVGMMFDEIKAALHAFGTDFDVWFHEQSLHDSGAVDRRRGAAQGVRASSTSTTAPGGSPPASTATTRTARSSSPTATRPTSRATSPTSSTSAPAASTCASTCSAPTTTATSAG